jgi:hypothetical protein
MRIAASVPLLISLMLCCCAGSNAAVPTRPLKIKAAGLQFVAASARLIASCHLTARAVGYPVPCPMRVPQGLIATAAGGPTGCTLPIIGPGGVGGCAKSWQGWVVGSGSTTDQHLVITASPHPLGNYAKVVNGPAWYPKARVKPVAWVSVTSTRMRAVFVPQETNDGSAFAHHVVLIWTVGEQTYGVGFHDVKGIRQTLLLDEELARSIELVRP